MSQPDGPSFAQELTARLMLDSAVAVLLDQKMNGVQHAHDQLVEIMTTKSSHRGAAEWAAGVITLLNLCIDVGKLRGAAQQIDAAIARGEADLEQLGKLGLGSDS